MKKKPGQGFVVLFFFFFSPSVLAVPNRKLRAQHFQRKRSKYTSLRRQLWQFRGSSGRKKRSRRSAKCLQQRSEVSSKVKTERVNKQDVFTLWRPDPAYRTITPAAKQEEKRSGSLDLCNVHPPSLSSSVEISCSAFVPHIPESGTATYVCPAQVFHCLIWIKIAPIISSGSWKQSGFINDK